MKTIYALAFGALALASCKTEDTVILDLAPETKEWLADQDGQTLTFANASGATQTIRVVRNGERHQYTGKSFTVQSDTEWNYLSYRRQVPADSGFGIAAKTQRAYFLNTTRPTRYVAEYVRPAYLGVLPTDYVVPYDDPNNGIVLQLRHNQQFGGRSYASLAMVDVSANDTTGPNVVPNRMRRIYYAKNHGLVGFRTANGQLWLRQ